MPPEQNQLSAFFCRNLPKHHGFSHIIQNLKIFHSQLLKNTISQPLKAYYVNIHRSMRRMSGDYILLRLHGKLLRHQHIILLPWIFYGRLNHRVI